MSKTNLHHSCACAALAVAMFSAGGAAAQDGDLAPLDTQNQIVVTGSLIRGTPEDAALPVDVFDTEQLAQEGVTSPLDFIKDIPAVGAVLGDSNQFSAAAQGLGGVGSLNLRNLGSTRTLVLLNGRRTIVSPGDGLVDTNLLPLFALERVELLKDGAAVTYGSDAVAGVANFITRKNFDGVEVQGDYRFIEDSDGDYTASILVGKNVGNDFNILAGFGYRHRSPLAAIDRDFANLDYETNPAGYSVVSNPATYFPAIRPTGPIRNNPAAAVRPTVISSTGLRQDAGCAALGGTQLYSGGAAPLCGYQFTDYNNLVEEQDFYQAYLQANADLSDSIRWNADALWAASDTYTALSPSYPSTTGPAGPGTRFNYYVPSSNPGFATFVAQTGFQTSTPLPIGPGGAVVPVPNGAAILVYRPFSLGGNPLADEPYGNESYSKNNSWRVSTGFEVDLSDRLIASLQGTYVQSSSESLIPDYLPVRLQNALDGLGGPDCNVATGTPGMGGCLYFNPFSNAIAVNQVTGQANPGYVGPAGQANANDPALVQWLFGNTGTFQQERNFIVDALISGDLGFDLGAGPVQFGVGAQYRSTNFTSRGRNDEGLFLNDSTRNPCPIIGDTTCAVRTGPFAFLGQSRNVDLDGNVYAFFGEVQVPILENLEVNAALRFEDYGGLTGSTLDPKGSFRFEATPWLVLRGSVSTTFRGPLPSNIAPSTVTALQAIDAANGGFLSVDITGDPSLRPESAFTYNLGAVIQTGGFNFSVDYWSYDFDDAIATQDENAIASAVIPTAGGPANCASPLAPLLTFAGGCTQGTTTGNDLARIQTFIVNSAPIKTDGIDLSADYTFAFGTTSLTLGAAATWTLNYDVDPQVVNGVEVSSAYDAVGFANFDRTPGTISEWKGNAFLNLNAGNLNARYVFRYASGVTDDRCPDNAPCFVSTYGTSFGDATTETDFGREIPDSMQHDFTVLYDLPFSFAEIQLQGSVENIFDQDPPEARFELGYNPFIGNPLGRTFRIGAKVRY